MKFSLAAATLLATLSTSSAFVAPRPVTASSCVAISATELFAERKPFITGNWKLNPSTKSEAIELASGVATQAAADGPDVAIFVPYPFLECVQNIVGGKINVGAEVSTCNDDSENALVGSIISLPEQKDSSRQQVSH